MTKQEIEEMIKKALAETFIEIKEQLNKEEPSGHWPGMCKSPVGSQYYRPLLSGSIGVLSCDTENEIDFTRRTHAMSNSRSEAAFSQRYLKARLEVIDLLLEKNGGDPGWIDWRDVKQPKWTPTLDHDLGKLRVEGYTYLQYRESWFIAKTGQIWMEVIDELGEETVRLALFPEYKPER